jgi:membrane-associated phospholipid phosphatase
MSLAFYRKQATLWPRVLLSWLGILLPLLLLGALSEDVWEGEALRFDAPILVRLHAHSSLGMDSAMVGLSRIGGGALLFVSALWVVWLIKEKRVAWARFLGVGVGGAALLDLAAKLVFGRARPDLWLSIAPESDYSFPSGHATLSSAFVACALVLLWRGTDSKLARIAGTTCGLLFVAGVGISRLYLGVHFPSDVLAAWTASALWVVLVKTFLFQPR